MPRSIQVLAGSFPIAQTREPYSAVGFLAERLEIEKVYGLQPPADEAVELDGAGQPMPFRWSAWTLCEALAQKKGFFNRQGQPDVYRGANFILREVLDGIVTFFFKPPK